MNYPLHTYLALAFLLTTTVYTTAQERMPFRLEGDLLIIKATLDGQTGNFLLDTGAPDLILNQAYFAGVRIPWDQKQIVDFNGHASEALVFAVKKFSIGELPIKKKYALTVDLTSVEQVKGIHLLGIIGYSVLKDLELLIDFYHQELTVAPAQRKSSFFSKIEPPTATYDLRFSGHLPFLIAYIGKKKLRFGLDTGAEVNIIDDKSFKYAAPHFDATKKLKVKGITRHQQLATSGVLRHLAIDGQLVDPLDVTVISIASLNESLTFGLDGILGMPFLREGRVGVDYGERELWVWSGDGLLVEEGVDVGMEVNLERQ